MKRLTPKQRLREIRNSLRRAYRRLRQQERRRDRLLGINSSNRVLRANSIPVKKYRAGDRGNAYQIDAPKEIDLRENYEETIKFVDLIKMHVFNLRRPVFLNFSEVQKIGSGGLLYLAAEVYRISNLRPNVVNGNYPKNKEILFQMSDLGFFRMLRVPDPSNGQDWNDDKFRIMGLRTGVRIVQNTIADLQDKILGDLTGVDDELKESIYGVMVEAMQNVRDHAYPAPKTGKTGQEAGVETVQRMRGRWWIGAFVNKQDSLIGFMMRDQGVGIPKTMPTRFDRLGGVERCLNAIGIAKATDSAYIQAATVYGRSSTELAHRGRGFKKMLDTVQRVSGGSLRVISGRGCYLATKKPSGQLEETRTDYSGDIGGTIVQWELRLNSEQGVAMEDVGDVHD